MIKKIFFSLCVLSNLTVAAHAANFSAGGMGFNKKVRCLKEIRQENVVTQSLDYSCGAAGLATLFHYYLNDPIPEVEIINSMLNTIPLDKVIARQGFSLFDLKKFAQSRGYLVTGYRMDFEYLKSLGKPVLVPIKFKNYRHFVVVKGVFGDRVFIADPAVGNMTMKKEKFMSMWTNGIGFVVERPGQEIKGDYALKVDQDDIRMTDYRAIKRFFNPFQLRTTIFTNEW